MWLTGRLMPDFKTIANFRKDNGKAIRSVCRQSVVLCQRLGLFTEALKQMRELKEVEVKLNETPDKQISMTDPDARSMKTRGNGIVG